MRLHLNNKKGQMIPTRHSCIAAALLGWLAGGCTSLPSTDESVQREIGCMGTRLEVQVSAGTRAKALQASEMALRCVEAAELRLSTWTDNSELSAVNRGDQATGLLAEELDQAQHWSDRTAGAFQPRAAALIQAWDLRGTGRIPNADECRTAAADHSQWEEGGFGKGAALDQAISKLQHSDATHAVLNLGGQIAVLPGSTTTIEISHPHHRQQAVASFAIDHGSVATSGNSERGLQVNGRKIGHLLDPRSGQPAPDFGSVTVWAPSALAADCLSTALYVMGPDAAMNWASQNPSIEVLILIATPTGLMLHATPELERRLQGPLSNQ